MGTHLRGTPCRTFITDMKLHVDTDSRRCDLYRKGSDGLWVLHPFEPDTDIRLHGMDLNLSAQALWNEIAPPESSQDSAPAP